MTPNPIATGGTISWIGHDEIHTFTSSGTFVLTENVTAARILVVGGGGAGGNGQGGGVEVVASR